MSFRREPRCNIFLREDIKNALMSVAATNAGAMSYAKDPQAKAYQEGFQAALIAIALAFGIQIPASGKTSLPIYYEDISRLP
jgi:hypothetical protein